MEEKQLKLELQNHIVEEVPEGQRYEVCNKKCCGRPASIRVKYNLLCGAYCSEHYADLEVAEKFFFKMKNEE